MEVLHKHVEESVLARLADGRKISGPGTHMVYKKDGNLIFSKFCTYYHPNKPAGKVNGVEWKKYSQGEPYKKLMFKVYTKICLKDNRIIRIGRGFREFKTCIFDITYGPLEPQVVEIIRLRKYIPSPNNGLGDFVYTEEGKLFESLIKEKYGVLPDELPRYFIERNHPNLAFMTGDDWSLVVKLDQGKRGFKTFLKKTLGFNHKFLIRNIMGMDQLEFTSLSQLLEGTENPDIANQAVTLVRQQFSSGNYHFIDFRLAKPMGTIWAMKHITPSIPSWVIEDTTRMIRKLDLRGRRDFPHVNLRELHDWAVHELRKPEANASLPQVSKLVGEKLEIQAPADTLELFDWGEKMHNCVSSYEDRILAKQYLVLGIFKEGELVANLGVKEKRVEQLFKARNQSLGPEDEEIKKICIDWCQMNNVKMEVE